jgi:hypothetical protein
LQQLQLAVLSIRRTWLHKSCTLTANKHFSQVQLRAAAIADTESRSASVAVNCCVLQWLQQMHVALIMAYITLLPYGSWRSMHTCLLFSVHLSMH